MHTVLKRYAEENIVRPNDTVVKNISTKHIPLMAATLDSILRDSTPSFPKGLIYNGCERCTPLEEYLLITRPGSSGEKSKRVFDIAESNIYMVKFLFSYQNQITGRIEDLPPYYAHLIYVGDAGITKLGGTKFTISPVMIDPVISPENNVVFVRTLRDRLIFERLYHPMYVNEVLTNTHVVFARIYRKTKKDNSPAATTKANTILLHYLLGKYGFVETFSKFTGIVPIVGCAEINSFNYPPDQYVICRTTGMKPKTCLDNMVVKNQLRFAIPIDKWNDKVKGFIASLIYIIDHFPDRINETSINNKELWIILLGNIIFSGEYGEHSLYNRVMDHYNTLDTCLDIMIIKKLKNIGYKVNNFYELLSLIMVNFNSWINKNFKDPSNVFGKTYEVLYFVLYNLTYSIFSSIYEMDKISRKKELTKEDIIDCMRMFLKTGTIFRIRSKNIAVNPTNDSTDHMFMKQSSIVILQAESAGRASSDKARHILSRRNVIHPSIALAGSLLTLSKSTCNPCARIGLYVNYNLSDGIIRCQPHLESVVSATNNKIKKQVQRDADFEDILEEVDLADDVGD